MQVEESAYAKINLFLDVTERRKDGFHNILSVMQSVSLCDKILLSATKSNKINIQLSCNDKSLLVDDSNLVWRAAKKYLDFYGINAEVEIELDKQIPIGAGLGGGSSNAAGTLRALDRIFGFAKDGELNDIASELGSDVPFCLIGGRALCTGRGERIEPIFDYPFNHFVIAIGAERVSTPAAYNALDLKYSNFDGNNYTPIKYSGQFYNIFESVTNIDEIYKIKEMMIKFGAESTLMSGSGPSVFGLFRSDADALCAEAELKKAGFSAYYCHTVKGAL